MNHIEQLFEDLNSKNNTVRYSSFKELMAITEEKVNWLYDYWTDLVSKLQSENSYQRSIGLMLIANLSKSDSENYSYLVLENFFNLFNDEKFITSRQCIQCVWKLALNNEENKKRIIEELKNTYFNNIHLSTHSNLIKQDVISSLHNIYKETNDMDLLVIVNQIIKCENDEKLKKSLKKLFKQNNISDTELITK